MESEESSVESHSEERREGNWYIIAWYLGNCPFFFSQETFVTLSLSTSLLNDIIFVTAVIVFVAIRG